MNEAKSAFETVLSGEASKLLHTHSATVLAKYGSLKKELEALQTSVSKHADKITKLVRTAKKQLDPFHDKFDPTSKAGIEDLSVFKFIETVGGTVISFISNSSSRLQLIEMYLGLLLPALGNKGVELQDIVLAEEAGSELIRILSSEFQQSVLGFEKLLASVYLGTRGEYKKLRRKFLGGTMQQDDDSVEDQLLMSFFGQRPPRRENTGPAVALVDENCILTQLLIDIGDSLPRYYEKVSPILKRGKLTGKTKTTKILDTGEIEDWAGTMMVISNPTYWNYINMPSTLTSMILSVVKSFQSEYTSIAAAIHALVMKANLEHEEKRRIIDDPNALVKQYNRINFLSIRPSAEDIAPRTKMDADVAVARTKLFVHLKETLQQLSGMDRSEQTTEDYAVERTKESIALKEAIDDIQRTEAQKNLKRNIADDNEFYVGKSGNIGTISSEREPAPKITYDDVIGASFIKAKQHVEEVVKVASHPHLMRLTAPRGNVKSNLLFIGPYGCHAAGQKILMYDGKLKLVEDIVVGDLLMGPDSSPREVLRLVRGVDDMVEIIPNKGDPWIVNQHHTMKLVKTQDRSKKVYRAIGELVEVSLNEYMNWPQYKKSIHPLYRVPIDFQPTHENTNLSIDPYFLGVLLGDGTITQSVGVTTADQEIHNEVFAQAAIAGLSVSVDTSCERTPTLYFSAGMRGGLENSYQIELKKLELLGCTSGTKFIPQTYKTASRSNRFQILAGLLDTDGHLHGNCFDYISKSEQLANDVAFVARSLGIAAYVKPCQKSSQNGTVGNYYRVSISGELDQIPTKILRKKASKRKRIQNVLRTGFSTRKLGKDNFYGFTVDVDNLYLLDDFTVIRNCGKTEIARAIGGDKRIIGFNVAVADMLTAYMHESVKNVKRVWDCAKDLRKGSRNTKPVGILMDEFDRLFNYGEGVHAAYDGGRMTGVLQEMMDGVVDYEGVFLVGMTNVPKQIPEAVLRRFKYVDVVGQLNQEERIKLFKMFLTRGLPVDTSVTDDDYAKWAEMLNHAPGDVIGKVTDEIHFKFMHELVTNDAKMIAALEKNLSRKLRNRDATKTDYTFLKSALGKKKMIGAADITTALESVIIQPQVKMQINKARQTYKDAEDILKGLSSIGESDHGFHGKKKSVVWE